MAASLSSAPQPGEEEDSRVAHMAVMKQTGAQAYARRDFEAALAAFLEAMNAAVTATTPAKVDGATTGPSGPRVGECQKLQVSCLFNASQCLFQLKRYEEAARAALDVLSLDPQHAKASFRAAESSLKLSPPDAGLLDACISHLQRLLRSGERLNDADRTALTTMTAELGLFKVQHFGGMEGGILHPPDPTCTRKIMEVWKADGWSCSYEQPTGGAVSSANLLVLLHGCGDTHENFIKFGARLELPETDVLSVGGPLAVPMMEGRMWYNAFDATTFDTTPLPKLAVEIDATAARLATTMTACGKLCGYRAIHILGLGDGATVSLQVIPYLTEESRVKSIASLGGSLVPGTRLCARPEAAFTRRDMVVTLVYPTEGRLDVLPTADSESRAILHAAGCHNVAVHSWSGPVHTPRAPDQARQLMLHFSAVLHRARGLESRKDLVRIA